MRALVSTVALILAVSWHARADELQNPAIDMAGYLSVAAEAARYRQARRVSEEEFLRMSREAGTLVLDARSREKYDELHVKGALNLSFADIAVASLRRAIPDKQTRILIYCNNNFKNAEGPFPTKLPSASLNLSTYIALFDYGYRNVYELGPLIDMAHSLLPFESAEGHGSLGLVDNGPPPGGGAGRVESAR